MLSCEVVFGFLLPSLHQQHPIQAFIISDWIARKALELTPSFCFLLSQQYAFHVIVLIFLSWIKVYNAFLSSQVQISLPDFQDSLKSSVVLLVLICVPQRNSLLWSGLVTSLLHWDWFWNPRSAPPSYTNMASSPPCLCLPLEISRRESLKYWMHWKLHSCTSKEKTQ